LILFFIPNIYGVLIQRVSISLISSIYSILLYNIRKENILNYKYIFE
jgi:hypothetical protein